MKHLLLKSLSMACLLIPIVMAQSINSYGNRSVVLENKINCQYWMIDYPSETDEISQVSNIFNFNYYFTPALSVSLRSAGAWIQGDVRDIIDMSDSQLGLKYKLEGLNLVLDFGLNLPTGKQKLTEDEFRTSLLMSQSIFNMYVPNFGQGLNYFGGISWATPVIEDLIFGIGTSYQIRGAYTPSNLEETKYQPSNELLVSAGMDYHVSPRATVSADITTIQYGSDKMGGEKVFSAGQRFMVSGMFQYLLNHNYLSILAHYRDQKADVLEGRFINLGNEKVNPAHTLVMINFYHFISRTFSLKYLLDYNQYEKTPALYSGYQKLGVGIESQIKISSEITIPALLHLFTGKNNLDNWISGFDSSIGIRLNL